MAKLDEEKLTDEVEVTPEMLNEGQRELAVLSDPALSSSVSRADLRAAYIAMRLLEPK